MGERVRDQESTLFQLEENNFPTEHSGDLYWRLFVRLIHSTMKNKTLIKWLK